MVNLTKKEAVVAKGLCLGIAESVDPKAIKVNRAESGKAVEGSLVLEVETYNRPKLVHSCLKRLTHIISVEKECLKLWSVWAPRKGGVPIWGMVFNKIR